jgi:hypothetical protein
VKRLFLLLSILAIAGSLFARAGPAQACTCAATLEDNIARSKVIVVANLGEIRFDPPLTVNYSNNRQTLVDLRVERYLKGSGPATLTVADPAYTVIEAENGVPKTGSRSCTIFGDRPVGRRYVLFLEATDPPVSPNYCGGSTELDNTDAPASEYLATVERLLTAERIPAGGGPPSRSSLMEDTVTLGGSIGVFAALAFLAGAALLGRRGESHNG